MIPKVSELDWPQFLTMHRFRTHRTLHATRTLPKQPMNTQTTASGSRVRRTGGEKGGANTHQNTCAQRVILGARGWSRHMGHLYLTTHARARNNNIITATVGEQDRARVLFRREGWYNKSSDVMPWYRLIR